ncbi:MAG: isopeptide-forming domain-containing fimbrial protein [Firmicutes bacterium]|nr:isopeptide-forming domain-containing fimbrial protein [Bacillota bacterium]
MKKLTRHFMAILLSLVMVMAMGMTAFAEETSAGNNNGNAPTSTYKLTLNGTSTGHTYEVYQIFTGDLSTNAEGKKVLSNVKWGNGVTASSTEKAEDVAKGLTDGTKKLDEFVDGLQLTISAKTVESTQGNTVIDGLAAGYYLVKDKDGTQANTSDAYTKFIVQVVGDTEAAIKSDVPTVEKKVKDTNDSTGETSGWQDSADYDFGDDVPYQITGTMPDNIADYKTYKYMFTDTMSKGLTYTANNVTIKIGEKDVTSSFKEVVTPNENGSTTVTWTCNNLKEIEGVTLDKNTTVVVNYTAQLNKNAVLGSAGNPNTVNLTYSNNPNKGGEGETGTTPEDKNIVFTYKVVVNKVDQDNKSLKGAAFKLQKKVKATDGKTEYKDVKSFTAGEEITFEFSGLDDGDYKLTETTTPDGYNTITPIEFTISATHDETADKPELISLEANTTGNGTTDATTGLITFTAKTADGSLTTDVVNKKGSTLPSTGGSGTKLLYIGGAILAVTAGTVLVLKKKMRNR